MKNTKSSLLKTLKSWIPKGSHTETLVYRIIPFSANVCLGAGIKHLIDHGAESKSPDAFIARGVAVLLVALVLTGVVLTTTIRSYIDDVKRKQSYKISIHQNLRGFKRKTAFDYCAAVAHQAKESIVIVGPHFPPAEKSVPTHDDYLHDGLEKALTRSDDAGHGTFYYRRIVQLDSNQFKSIQNDGAIEEAVIGNAALAEHLKQCIKKNKENEALDIKFYGKVYIPSFPSVMIVDERHVFFSLPTESWQLPPQREASSPEQWAKVAGNGSGTNMGGRDQQNNARIASGELAKTLDFDFVLAIEDDTGEIPRAFMKIASQFEIDSREIKKVNFPAQSSTAARVAEVDSQGANI